MSRDAGNGRRGTPVITVLRDVLQAWPQYLLPQHALSRAVHRVTRSRRPGIRDPLLRWFLRRYRVDLGEARYPDPGAYLDFNSFFTRALRPGARPQAPGAAAVLSPADGVMNEFGVVEGDRLIQAKGRAYSLTELLGGDPGRAGAFRDGAFATLYLAPRNYHRVHMPCDGELREMRHVPGALFSVSEATARRVPRLFARNERVIAHFDTALGPMALVLVGALLVGSIETVWAGPVSYPYGRRGRVQSYPAPGAGPVRLARGAEMGRFSMGSTVIVLFAPGRVAWDGGLAPSLPVRVGQRLGEGLHAEVVQTRDEPT